MTPEPNSISHIAAPVARRGFLRGVISLAPAAAIAAAGASPAAATSPQQENRRLLWLGEQLTEVDGAFNAAISRKAEARAAADRQWPAPAAEITFPPGEREPVWCGVQPERDIDDKVVYQFENDRSYRKIADAWQLENYLSLGGGRTRDAKAAKKLLASAREYENAREAIIESTGYSDAKDQIFALTRRIDRIVDLIYKCEATTHQGLAIKARALVLAVKAGEEDGYMAHRAKVRYAETLAGSVLGLSGIKP